MAELIPAHLAEAMAAQDCLREASERFINDLMDDFDARWITGNGSGGPRGFIAIDHQPPTPTERAMAILAPHLAREPRYQTLGTPL